MLDLLRDLIFTGEYGPNRRLIEAQLAERLEVSRTLIRRALTMLEAEGLVGIAGGAGARLWRGDELLRPGRRTRAQRSADGYGALSSYHGSSRLSGTRCTSGPSPISTIGGFLALWKPASKREPRSSCASTSARAGTLSSRRWRRTRRDERRKTWIVSWSMPERTSARTYEKPTSVHDFFQYSIPRGRSVSTTRKSTVVSSA